MNFHSDEWIMKNVKDHFNDALQHFPRNNIIAIVAQGSPNYGLDTKDSDVDTKLAITPPLKDLILAKQPISTTHVRENNEHIDFKDIRLLLNTFRKQNLNFIEILFSSYFISNRLYEDEWCILQANRELIARYSPANAVKTMKGIALEKYHALEHEYPSKLEIIRTYGFDAKQLHHLVRVHEFIQRYTDGVSYINCLHSQQPVYLKSLKQQGCMSLKEAREFAKETLDATVKIADTFIEKHKDEPVNEKAEQILTEVQYSIMKKSIKYELEKEE